MREPFGFVSTTTTIQESLSPDVSGTTCWKKDVGTQVDPSPARLTNLGLKRTSGVLDLNYEHSLTSPSPKCLALGGVRLKNTQKVVHVNPNDYEVRPFDLVTEEWVSDKDARFIYQLLSYRNDQGFWAPIHRVPSPPSWAVVDENPSVMHRLHMGRPLLVWVIGSLREIHLTSPYPATRPLLHVTIEFLRDVDQEHTALLLSCCASIPVGRSERLTVTTPQSEDEGDPAHLEVYDARKVFQAKTKLEHISPGRMSAGDIVMLECTVVQTEAVTNLKTVALVLSSLYWIVAKPKEPTVLSQRVVEFSGVITAD